MEVSKGQRLYIGLFGNTNSGKSSLMNMLVGQDFSIVSELSGTTTDSVQKNMELPGVGPAVFIDTAGFNDDSKLGQKRIVKTYEALAKCDIILAVISSEELGEGDTAEEGLESLLQSPGFQKLLQSKKPVIWVITKSDSNETEVRIHKLLQTQELFKTNLPIFVDSLTGICFNPRNIFYIIQIIN